VYQPGFAVFITLGLVKGNNMQLDQTVIRGMVEIIAALLMLGGLVGVLWHRFKQERGLSTISIQFLSIVFVFSSILILALEGILKGEVTGTLIGALAGYLFAEFGKKQPTQSAGTTAAASTSSAAGNSGINAAGKP
jgi:hypothetical protein